MAACQRAAARRKGLRLCELINVRGSENPIFGDFAIRVHCCWQTHFCQQSGDFRCQLGLRDYVSGGGWIDRRGPRTFVSAITISMRDTISGQRLVTGWDRAQRPHGGLRRGRSCCAAATGCFAAFPLGLERVRDRRDASPVHFLEREDPLTCFCRALPITWRAMFLAFQSDAYIARGT